MPGKKVQSPCNSETCLQFLVKLTRLVWIGNHSLGNQPQDRGEKKKVKDCRNLKAVASTETALPL